MTKNDFIKKLKELFVGKRSLKNRLWEAFFPALCLSFILCFFGPLDLSHIAEDYVAYNVLDILPACLKLWGICFAVTFLAAWLFGGKIHVWLCSLYSGLALAFYIQGNWLNPDLGTLDGSSVEWPRYGDNALLNLLVFAIILLIPLLIHFFSRKIWQKFVILISLLLLAMQMVPLGMMLTAEFKNRPPSEYHFRVAKDKEFVLGKENIVVFVLDNTGPEEMTKLLNKYPDSLEFLHDFTFYDNFNTEYHGTFPGAAYLLTHEKYDGNLPYEEWLKQAWLSDDAQSFYHQLADNGWTTRLFNSVDHTEGNPENVYGLISNFEKVNGQQEFTINKTVFRKLIKLVCYRYFPLIMKAPFRIYTADLNRMKNLTEDEEVWKKHESLGKYLDRRLSVGNEEKVYMTYHWAGAHNPYYLNEWGRFAVGMSSLADQLKGHFYVISEYLQQMKDYGIYDESTVIITADHGGFAYPHSILFIKPAGQQQDEMTTTHAPVSQSDFMETIAEYAGLEKGQFGQSVMDISEDEERERCTYIRWRDPALPRVPGKSSNALQEYCYVGDSDTLRQMIVNKDFTSIPLEHPFY